MPSNTIINTNGITWSNVYTGATTNTYYYDSGIRNMLNFEEQLQRERERIEAQRHRWRNPYDSVPRYADWHLRDRNNRLRQTAMINASVPLYERAQEIARVLRLMCALGSNNYSQEWMDRHEYNHVRKEHAQEHSWHKREQDRYGVHPAVRSLLDKAVAPTDLHLLILEWPHVSQSDSSRVAYTRSNEHGHADRQTVTGLGKYLRRHFPDLADSTLRDIVMRYGPQKFEMWDTVDKIVEAVQKGPQSCMRWSNMDKCDWHRHPYNVYDPKYGWRVAVRLEGDAIVGRCLVNVSGEGDHDKMFVRSYAHKEGGYSHSDEALEVWLRDQGFVKGSDWEGCRLAKITKYYHPFLAPYLDGNNKNVRDHGEYLVVNSDGEYTLDNTDGYPANCGHECEDCGSHVDEDDIIAVGYNEDRNVCRHCIEHEYYWVQGRRGNHYYLHCDYAVQSSYTDEWYDRDYLRDNNMVWLEDGEVCPEDDAVYLEARDEWRHCDDEDVVYCEREGVYQHIDDCVELHDHTYAHADDAWECEASGAYYHDDDSDEKVEVCDATTKGELTVHADNLEDYFGVDLDDVADACEELLEETEAN